MSVTTIRIPAEQVGAIRASLLAACGELDEELSRSGRGSARPDAAFVVDPAERLVELEGLLGQIGLDATAGSGPHELTGSRGAIWSAFYDAVCATSERIAEELNDYWRGAIDPAVTRAQIGDLGVQFDLLESLGTPPGGRS